MQRVGTIVIVINSQFTIFNRIYIYLIQVVGKYIFQVGLVMKWTFHHYFNNNNYHKKTNYLHPRSVEIQSIFHELQQSYKHLFLFVFLFY